MKRRSPAIPPQAFEGKPFEVGGGGAHFAQAVSLDHAGGRLWSAILDYPDENVARRTWVTEICIGEKDNRTAFGARLINVTRGEDVPFQRSRPGIIRQMLNALSASVDDRPLTDIMVPRHQIDSTGLDDFLDLLEARERHLPILAISVMPNQRSVINPESAFRELSGFAHILLLDEDACWQLTRAVGKRFSVFQGSARIYWQGFDTDREDPFAHPLWVKRADSHDDTNQVIALDEIAEVLFFSSLRPAVGDDFPRFDEIRRHAARVKSEKAKQDGMSAAELLKLYEEVNASLQEDIEKLKDESNQLLQQMDAENVALNRALDDRRREASGLRARVELLEASMQNRGQVNTDKPLLALSDIEEWAELHLAGSIWISPKAIKEMKKHGEFRDPAFLGQTLLMLRDFLVPMKKHPGADRRSAYESQLHDLNLADELCFSDRGAIKDFPEYSVTYGLQKWWCENHIKFGGGTDPRSFFRIYYVWHEDERLLLIGHMPTHLDNKLTN